MFPPVFPVVNDNVFSSFGGGSSSSLANGLIDYWRLEEASGARLGAAQGLTLSDVNTVANGTGIIGNAASFIPVNNERLQILGSDNSNFVFGNSSYSFSLWYNIDVLPPVSYGLISRATSAPFSYLVTITGGTGINFQHFDNVGTLTALTLAVTLTTSTWNFVCVVYDHDHQIMKIQHNTMMSQRAVTGGGASETVNQLVVGAQDAISTRTIDGRIDEFVAWNRALSDGEIAQIYNGGLGNAYPF